MPCTKPHDTLRPSDSSGNKVAVRRKLEKLGIEITAIRADQRRAVRIWAASLTEAEVEYVIGGTDNRVLETVRTEVVTEQEESLDIEEAEPCSTCDSTICKRCGRCEWACRCE